MRKPVTMRMRALIRLVSACTVVLGCADGTTTPARGVAPKVLVTADRSGEFRTQLSLAGDDSVPLKSVVVAGMLESALTLGDSSTMLMGVVNADASRELITLDTRTLSERSRRVISRSLVPVDQASVGLRALVTMTESADRRSIYVSQAIRDGVGGLARVNAQSLISEAFSGPWLLGSPVRLMPPTASRPDGALVMVASRENSTGGSLRSPTVFLLHPSTLAPLDSLSPSELEFPGAIINLLVTERGASLIVGTGSRLMRFDMAQRRITAQTVRRGLGGIVATSDGRTIVALDQGQFPELAGSGMVYVYDANLALTDSVDVSTALGGTPHSLTATVMGGAVLDETTGELYLRTGSPPFGSLYPIQPARVVVVSLRDRRVVRAIPIPGDNFGFAFRLGVR